MTSLPRTMLRAVVGAMAVYTSKETPGNNSMIALRIFTEKRLTASIILFLLFALWGSSLECRGAAAGASPSGGKRDEQRLAGSWVRPDGGYVLEIKEIAKDGTMRAAYFNPQPINVFQAAWSRLGGTIKLLVELRDFNYPGSKYSLQYDPRTDRLVGTYFQAIQRATYDVEFIRVK